MRLILLKKILKTQKVMIKSKIQIDIDKLETIIQKVLESLRKECSCINISTNYYWEVPITEKFLLDIPNVKSLTLGSLLDDIDDINKELDCNGEMIIWWDCELISRLFMAIGYEILSKGTCMK